MMTRMNSKDSCLEKSTKRSNGTSAVCQRGHQNTQATIFALTPGYTHPQSLLPFSNVDIELSSFHKGFSFLMFPFQTFCP